MRFDGGGGVACVLFVRSWIPRQTAERFLLAVRFKFSFGPFFFSFSILPLNLPLDYFAGLFKRKQKNERYKTKIRNGRKQKKSLLAARKVFITTSRSH